MVRRRVARVRIILPAQSDFQCNLGFFSLSLSLNYFCLVSGDRVDTCNWVRSCRVKPSIFHGCLGPYPISFECLSVPFVTAVRQTSSDRLAFQERSLRSCTTIIYTCGSCRYRKVTSCVGRGYEPRRCCARCADFLQYF